MIEEYITSWVTDQQMVIHGLATIFKNFYFEIIMDSLETAKIEQRKTVYTSPKLPQW